MYTTLISCRQLREHIVRPGWVIVDCRYDLLDKQAGQRAYRDGHLPRAVYAHLHEHLSSRPVTDSGRHPLPSADKMEQVFSGLGIDNGSQVVVYDASFGAIAARLWWMLKLMGHESAAVLDGGWQSWTGHGYETETRTNKNPRRTFKGNPDWSRLITIKDFPLDAKLIDSREPERYRGESEPIDPVAGHIPGAINYFWKSNITDAGTFRPPEYIRTKLLSIHGDAGFDSAVFYCGSGVSACHNALAACYAGLSLPRLYAGSWSEWCGDPARPVATGNGG